MNNTNSTETPQALLAATYFGIALEGTLCIGALISLILIVVFRNQEPIKGRRIVSFVTTFIFLWEQVERCSFMWVTNSYQFIRGSIGLILLSSIPLAFWFMYLQYTVRKYSNAAKTRTTGTKSRAARVAEALVSNWAYAIVLVSYLIMITALMVGLNYAYFTTPNGDALLFLYGNVVAIALSGMFITIILLVGLIDFILDVKEHGFWTGYLYSRDPLNFRIDFFWIMLCASGAVVYLIIALASPSGNIVANWIGLLPEYVFRGSMLMVAGVSCELVIIRRKIIKQTLKKGNRELGLTKTEKLMRVLCDEKLAVEFEKYCNAEFSTENILAFHDLMKYLECTNRQEKLILLRQIYDKFVQLNAINEVNIPEYVRHNLRQVIEHADSISEEQDLNVLIEKFMQEVKQNLTDTFSRFMYSESYLKHSRRSSFVKMMNNPEFVDPTLKAVPKQVQETISDQTI